MITQRIMSGLNFKQIADMCGTSVMQIQRTYYHLNDEIRLTKELFFGILYCSWNFAPTTTNPKVFSVKHDQTIGLDRFNKVI